MSGFSLVIMVHMSKQRYTQSGGRQDGEIREAYTDDAYFVKCLQSKVQAMNQSSKDKFVRENADASGMVGGKALVIVATQTKMKLERSEPQWKTQSSVRNVSRAR